MYNCHITSWVGGWIDDQNFNHGHTDMLYNFNSFSLISTVLMSIHHFVEHLYLPGVDGGIGY